MEKWPEYFRVSTEWSIKGDAGRGILIGVSNLTVEKKSHTDSQRKQARKRKTFHHNSGGLTGSS